MSRPLRRYIHSFSHPRRAVVLELEASGCTPCEARSTAWAVLEEAKRGDASLPQDDRWRLVGQITPEYRKAMQGR